METGKGGRAVGEQADGGRPFLPGPYTVPKAGALLPRPGAGVPS